MALPSETKTWADIQATTIENYRPMFYDQVTDAIPMIKVMKDRGSVVLEGGDGINETLMYRHSDAIKSFSGYDAMPLVPQDVLTVAKYDWADIAGSWGYSQDEVNRNRSKEQMKSLAKARIKQLKLSFNSTINEMLYGDGTGNDGKDIQGLAKIVSDSATNTVGGVSKTANAWFRNVSYCYDTCDGATAVGQGARQGGTLNTQSVRQHLANVGGDDNYDTTYLMCLDHVFEEVCFGDTGPHFGVCDYAAMQRLKHTMYTYKRFDMNDTGEADPGFRHVKFNGIPIIFDRAMPTTTNGTSTCVSRMYFLNMDFMNWYIHSGENFRTTEVYSLLPQQKAYVGLMFLKSQLTSPKPNAQAVIHSLFA